MYVDPDGRFFDEIGDFLDSTLGGLLRFTGELIHNLFQGGALGRSNVPLGGAYPIYGGVPTVTDNFIPFGFGYDLGPLPYRGEGPYGTGPGSLAALTQSAYYRALGGAGIADYGASVGVRIGFESSDARGATAIGASLMGEALQSYGYNKSLGLYGQGWRQGVSGNYLLRGRNLSLFGNAPVTSRTLPISRFTTLGRGLSFTGTGLTIANVGIETWQLRQGTISTGRYAYHTGTTALSLATLFLYGSAAGTGVGAAAIAGEMAYNGIRWYIDKLSELLGRIEHAMKRGWNPNNLGRH